ILKIIRYISEKTKEFTNPKLVMIGGYALRAFIKFSRYTRDCDFIVKKRNGWHLDELNEIIPRDWRVNKLTKRDQYGFMRWLKFIRYDKTRIKVSLDFMEGEIRGREEEEVILIDYEMIEKSRQTLITIADEEVRVFVPDYGDYFTMKVISCRASDIRDIASLIHENGVPKALGQRVEKILPNPNIFYSRIGRRVIPEIKRETFIDSWKGIMATTEYIEEDKEKVVEELKQTIHLTCSS
ncbi:nucleotidyl transferase AbiEii/AbiGii toxin family protein, partial [Candidatus Bathyarchaeota archaeon]|nr:nucleotidyl transferase AbiEii/AbiGii toxin family protein [Candidatus Bathyarchaeota archaeon]